MLEQRDEVKTVDKIVEKADEPYKSRIPEITEMFEKFVNDEDKFSRLEGVLADLTELVSNYDKYSRIDFTKLVDTALFVEGKSFDEIQPVKRVLLKNISDIMKKCEFADTLATEKESFFDTVVMAVESDESAPDRWHIEK